MNATTVVLVGRVGTEPVLSTSGGVDRVKFRMVASDRRLDASTGQWVDQGEFWADVVCWRQVASGVHRMVRKGDPILLNGRISSRTYERTAGGTGYATEVTADAVGFDVSRAKERIQRVGGALAAAAGPETADRGEARDHAVAAADDDLGHELDDLIKDQAAFSG